MKLLLGIATLLLMVAVWVTAAGVPTAVTYVPHDKVAATHDQGIIKRRLRANRFAFSR